MFHTSKLKMYKLDERGGFIIPCFSARSAIDNIPNQPISKKGGQAQHLEFLPVWITLELSKSLQRPGKLIM
jgi:hypothetical protein